MITKNFFSAVLTLLGAIAVTLSCQGKTESATLIQMKRHEFSIRYPLTQTKTAILEYPVFLGSPHKELLDKINFSIGPEGVLGKNASELGKDFAEGAIPFESAQAELIFHGKGLLQVLWKISSTGAYTSTSQISVIADLEKGITHGPESMFEDDLAMARFVDERIKPLVEKRLSELFAQHTSAAPILRGMGIPLPYGPDDLFNLLLDKDGIRFVYSFKFPQAFASIEPEPLSLFLPWQEIKPFLYEGCVLQRFY